MRFYEIQLKFTACRRTALYITKLKHFRCDRSHEAVDRGKEMAIRKVTWGNKSFKGNAEIVANEIESIQFKSEDEDAKAHEILRYAETHEDSELHRCFTWDNGEAAHKWRVHEARQIVCNLVIKYIPNDEKEKPVTIRWAFRTSTTGGYKKTEVIIQKPDEKKRLLEMAKAELLAFKHKYSVLSDNDLMRKVFLAIEELN